jgi:hypothetical protein
MSATEEAIVTVLEFLFVFAVLPFLAGCLVGWLMNRLK